RPRGAGNRGNRVGRVEGKHGSDIEDGVEGAVRVSSAPAAWPGPGLAAVAVTVTLTFTLFRGIREVPVGRVLRGFLEDSPPELRELARGLAGRSVTPTGAALLYSTADCAGAFARGAQDGGRVR